jgi:hypothetical protein
VGFSSPAAEGTALATFEGDSADERFEEPSDLVVHRGHDEALVALVVCRHFRQPNGFYEVVV